jgi:hypothetical protein
MFGLASSSSGKFVFDALVINDEIKRPYSSAYDYYSDGEPF